MELNLISNERYYLQKLSTILNYELSTSILFLLSFFTFILIALASAAMIIFTPFMVYIFVKLRKATWVITFGIIVILPLTLSVIIGLEIGHIIIFLAISLICFYFYCFMLKYIVNDQLKELQASEELELRRQYEKTNGML